MRNANLTIGPNTNLLVFRLLDTIVNVSSFLLLFRFLFSFSPCSGETESFLILLKTKRKLWRKEGPKVPRFATMSRKMSFNSLTQAVKNIPKVSSRSILQATKNAKEEQSIPPQSI